MSDKQTMGFQTEAKRLLQLMIHSLYSNREIFLRELISNASDAIDKRRFAAIEDSSLDVGGEGYEIRVDVNEDEKTLTLIDNGIGMSRDDIIENLGTIAKSGTAAFMDQLSGDQQKDSQLIGQFGVGFYSSFIVADRVEVISRKVGEETATRWESTGEDEFSIDAAERDAPGTTVILHLDGEAEEFASSWRVRSVIKKYSDHISVPVLMLETPPSTEDDEEAAPEPSWERINEAKALWTRSRSEVTDDEYTEFYRHVSSDYQDPLSWSHNRVEGKLDYTSLLYVPSQAPFDLWNREAARGLKLYIQRTFIMDDAEQFLPLYLRFVKGVLDSQDLPLNISREILQQSPQVDSLRNAVTKRVLDMLSKMAKSDSEKYQSFWDVFGNVLKEGPGEDFANREKIAELLRFASSHSDDATQNVSL
ncbi:MAG: molecular chaperone HtpG, partial [Luminiphilus sp.]|nr:molecular chaperone HtpG [Luminiphilus sp.]